MAIYELRDGDRSGKCFSKECPNDPEYWFVASGMRSKYCGQCVERMIKPMSSPRRIAFVNDESAGFLIDPDALPSLRDAFENVNARYEARKSGE